MLRRNITDMVIVVACVLYVISLTGQISLPSGSDPGRNFYSVSYPSEDTAFGGIFYRSHINDSLPYYQYKHIEDSIRQIKEKIKQNNNRLKSGMFLGSFGVVSMEEEEKEPLYYLSLEGYKVKNHLTQFFRDKGTDNLAYLVADSVPEYTGAEHFERRKIAVRFAADDQRVLVPLTKQQYRTILAVCCIAGFVLIFLWIYTVMVLPIRIVTSISKGRAFTQQNVQRFRLISIGLLVFSLVALFAPYLLRLFFQHTIPDEFGLKSFWEALFQQLRWILGALCLFIIGKAFEKGYKLQQENTLTI